MSLELPHFDPRLTRVVLTPRVDGTCEQEIRVHPETMQTLCETFGKSRRAGRDDVYPVLSPAQAVLHALSSKTALQMVRAWQPETLERLVRADRNLRALLENALAGSGIKLVEEN